MNVLFKPGHSVVSRSKTTAEKSNCEGFILWKTEFRGIYSWLWINWRRRNMAATLQMPFPNSFSWQFDWFECRWFLFLKVQFRRMSSSKLHKWASCQIRNFAGCACAAYIGSVFPATDFKGNLKLATPTCTTARASRTCRDACWDCLTAVAGKTFRAFQAHVQPTILRIWLEAQGIPPPPPPPPPPP